MIMFMVGINFILCTAIAFIAICRLRNSLSTVNKIIRAQYTLVVEDPLDVHFKQHYLIHTLQWAH